MMPGKAGFHVGKNGVAPCNATIGACTAEGVGGESLTPADHFSGNDFIGAQKSFEEKAAAHFNPLTPLKKKDPRGDRRRAEVAHTAKMYEILDKQKILAEKLPEQAKEAVRYYSGNGYDVMNSIMRGDFSKHKNTAEVRKAIRLVEKIFSLNVVKAEEELTVYRYQDEPPVGFDPAIEGEQNLRVKGYLSTTVTRGYAFNKPKKHKMTIKVPQGTPALAMNTTGLADHESEDEVLINADQVLVVERVEELQYGETHYICRVESKFATTDADKNMYANSLDT